MKRYILVLIFVIGILVRFIGLGTIPPGLTDDEADKGYDAYSLLKTGKDQWGAPWPIFAFKGFGDYRTPLYTYLTIPTVKLFGLTPFAVRFPSALFGSLTILLTYFLVKELFQKSLIVNHLSLITSFLLALSPWHIGMSRMAMEVTVSVFLVVFGIYLLSLEKKIILFSAIVFGLSVYAYPAQIVFVPLIVAIYIFLFKLRIQIFPIIVFFCIALPVVFVGNTASRVRTQQVNLTNDKGIIDLLNEKRGACTERLPGVICRIALNKYYVYGKKFIENYITHFSPNLLAISGSHTQLSALPERGLLYLVELPFLLLGIYVAFRTKNKAGIFITLFLLASAIPDSATSYGHYGRFFISLPAWQILTSIGILQIPRLFLPFVTVLYFVEICNFGLEYTTYFPYRYSRYSHYGYKELVSKTEENKLRYDKILVSSSVNDAKQYIFYLFYTKYDPLSFQQQIEVKKGFDSLGWVRVERIGSISFVQDLPKITKDTVINDRELFIGEPSEFPKNTYIPVQFVVKDKKGDVVFQAVDVQDYVRCMSIVCM